MYLGRSIWTRGVLALGVGALFLLGCRFDSDGDESSSASASQHVNGIDPISRDSSSLLRDYFVVTVASSRSPRIQQADTKKENTLDDGPVTVGSRQDPRAFNGGYSERRNVESDGDDGPDYSVETSLPADREKSERSEDYRRFGKESDSKSPRNEVRVETSAVFGRVEGGMGRDENQFLNEDGGTRGALNGSGVGEGSVVKENFSRDVNGEPMNEVEENSRRSYSVDVDSNLFTINDEELGSENNIEGSKLIETNGRLVPFERYSIGNDAGDYGNTEQNVGRLGDLTQTYHLSSEIFNPRELTSEIEEAELIDRSVIETRDSGFLKGSVDDIQSSGRFFDLAKVLVLETSLQKSDKNLDGEESSSRKRNDELLSSFESPLARSGTTRRVDGTTKDLHPFFREDHRPARSSAKLLEAFGSRNDRSRERDHGKVLERGRRETRSRDSSPEGSDLSANFRPIDVESTESDGKTNRYETRDRLGRRSKTEFLFSFLPRSETIEERVSDVSPLIGEQLTPRRELTDAGMFVNERFGSDVSSDIENGVKRAETGSSDDRSSLFPRVAASQRERRIAVRRKRYMNYYSPQPVTPMAYVHIQPAYPVPAVPPANRKCVRCMVVYKPCPSSSRQPSRHFFPTYPKYQEPASKWHGLKYGCRCNPIGSITTACDIVTGQCQCKFRVTGRQCNQCMTGFWGLATGAGCAPCECDPIGSHNSSCHDDTGQCYCKPGIGGTRCETCLPGYYGFSSNGCQVCDPCVRPGHICDPDTGRCVCPIMTFGEHCDRCRPGSWDLVPGIGCRACDCTLGSTRPQCDHQGQCPCRIGYDGLRCEKCAKGYYGYPRCRPCSCNFAGTLQCNDEVCDCNEEGQCPCKEHVFGRQCNKCKEGTFGLAVDNPKGCTECFCFGRTASCQQADLSWGHRRLARPRILYVNDTSNDIIVSKFRSQIFLSSINGGLNVTNGLSTIPDIEGDVTIPSNLYYNYPLYWMLPEPFLGDKVVSYGGFLRFKTWTEGGIPLRSTMQYPVVQLQGNKIVLEYYLPLPMTNNRYDIRFHESLWQLQNRPDYKVTREVLMVALQNVQHILVKASDNAEFTKTTLLEASIDAAVLTPTHTPSFATSIEICKCPPEYNSTSCQDPSIGYYRWYKNTTVTSTIIIDLVGQAKRCQCNGRSEVCDRETGYCLNCRGNSAGPQCDACADSFYGDPEFGGCKPCPCPRTDKRFSNTCMVRADAEPICVCKPGYTGRTCERCSYGYYGFPNLPDGKCVPCNCNPAGSLNDECDTETGQCKCRAGSTGRDCSQCTAYRHVYINNVCTSCNDNCTGVLLDTVALLSQELADGTSHIADGYIPPPWKALSYIDSNVTTFFEEIDRQNKLKQRMENIPWHEYKKLLKHAEMLLRTANEQAKQADTLQSKSNDLKNNLFSAKIEVDNLRKHIDETILRLNQYSNDNKRIEIKKALKMAKMILNSLKAVNLTTKTMEIESFLEDIGEYTDWLKSLYDATEPFAIAHDDAEEYSVKLTDMRNVIEDAMDTLFDYDSLYNNINQTFVESKNDCNEINALWKEVNESIITGKKMTDETQGFVVDIQNNVQDLPELQNKLNYWFDKLSMKEELLYRLNYEYNDKYVVPAVQHAKNLSNYVDQYVSLFSETRSIAASPLKASQAYKNIVDNINAANVTAMAAKDITEDIYNKTFPNGPKSKSLLDNAEEISMASSKQMDSAKKHRKLVENANDELDIQKKAVTTLKNTLNYTGIRDNKINMELQNLQDDSKKLREGIQNVLEDNEEVLESMQETQKLINDYTEGIADRLKPKMYELKEEGDSKISLASEKLTEALSKIKEADAKLISLSNAAIKRKNVFDKWNDTLATKLQNLKDKIAEARNTADGIRVSMKSADGKECIRSYKLSTLQPTSTNTIVMTFALPKGKEEGSLFYLPSSINDDFIALEIVNRRVRFVWNVGGDTGFLTHSEVIESGNIRDDRFWYRIEAERIRHVGKLLVRKQSSTIGRKIETLTNKTESKYSRFDITTSDRVWIGGIPKDLSQRRRIELISTSGLPGCVHRVILDGKSIGLWNFITTAPDMACIACVEGLEDARDDTTYSFNGEGYAVRNRVSSGPYNKYIFGVSMNFRTYDENALLFLAFNPLNNQHIMIFLREGKVIFRVGYGGNVSIEMFSKQKHNNGNWTKVNAFRQYHLDKNIEQCTLRVGEKDDTTFGAPTPQPKKEDFPDLAQAKYYIGGVPPSFRAEKLMLPSQVSFLGCMSNIVIQEGYDPMAEQYYGVEPSCGNKALKIVGFYGNGYLEHSSFTLKKLNSTVSFSFRTMQTEAVLLLSTFEGQEERINRNSFYSVCVINGQVQVRMNAGRGELVLQSNVTFNDGRYHSVTIIKSKRNVELWIDDALQNKGVLASRSAIKAPGVYGGLFFGGLPELINNTKMIATTTPLYGAIKDAIFDDEKNVTIIRFDEVINFEHALIGRPGPSMGKDPPTYTPSASLSTQPEGCLKVPYYSLEPGALKFGDKPNSHTQLYLNIKKFWEKKYAIEFDFRTYYPNGLLFITPGMRPKYYLMIVVQDGQLLLLVKTRKKRESRKEILFKTPFNDGNWHHVVISHDRRKLTLLVDSQTPSTIKVPKNIGLAPMMYIGGLPESGTLIPEQVVVKLETLKGCIRGLRVNGNVYDMVGSTSKAYQVGQCFPNVESGAYFQDEAYAIYKRNFELGAVLELQLEFRTSELSGVLLSITAPGNSPSLSLELNDGKIVMSGDLGYNNPLYVEQRFTSPYTICDNRWHRIQAVYNDEQLALKVDELDQKYGLPISVNYHIMGSTAFGPLYIGGLPASAPKGTLITRDHFNGCIRNVMIGGERRDWTDMDELHNIHLSSCPVQ
ncbi:laminin subunit alpha-1-like isoform X1 [Hylaeus volcanicus]|uniref:laminin subunit alpha-1-like isoform X1 n=2 Tax=Hylaeus volcanicus TaxID=313075 RepID=UPI0023B85D7F|nr:laminin subunit alpha-1-like isoform X1 [Hylaeus volcanicus]